MIEAPLPHNILLTDTNFAGRNSMNNLVVNYSAANGMRRVPTHFATSGYYSVQIGENKIFQVLHCSPGCRMLER